VICGPIRLAPTSYSCTTPGLLAFLGDSHGPAVARPIETPPETVDREPDYEQDCTFDHQADLGRFRQVGEVAVGQGDHQTERRREDEGVGTATEGPLNEDRRQYERGAGPAGSNPLSCPCTLWRCPTARPRASELPAVPSAGLGFVVVRLAGCHLSGMVLAVQSNSDITVAVEINQPLYEGYVAPAHAAGMM
jgi:hypothetical protein